MDYQSKLLIARLLLLLLSCLLWTSVEGDGRRERSRRSNTRDVCFRDPPETVTQRTPGDGGMRIQITGHAEKYSPGQVYTITINGSYKNQRLLGFMLVAVPINARDESTSIGTFQNIDASGTRFFPHCPHVLTHTDLRPKFGVEILWTAPASRTGCVEFRATVLERRDVWYKDDGALTKFFCENSGTTEDSRRQDVVPDCCACGTAKYQMTFDGQWNQRTHPKDYPTQKRLLHWSNLVGASHSKNYVVWQYGAYASKGVKEVCEFGYPRTVEEEIQKNSREVRSIIKTTGVWWKEPEGLDQTRQARFSTDRRRHLVSMLTMIGPSPDWCVGISAVDLCLPNCTWSGDLRIDLYPWDSGTDDGITYMAPNAKSDPQQKIHRITNRVPDDSRSPFYGSEPIRPLAVLRIERISQPEGGDQPRQCTDTDTDDSDTDFIGTGGGADGGAGLSDAEKQKQMMMSQDGKCAMSAWEDWSSCSVTCGVGQRFRKRMYFNPMVDEAMCGQPTMETENCIGIENECETIDEDCAVTQWSNWSPCSVTCGKGMRERQRYYLNKEDMLRCDRTTQELDVCMSRTLDCDEAISAKNYTAICALPSLGGPCRGDFDRWYFDVYMQKCLPFSYGGCRGNENRFETMDDCTHTCQLSQAGDQHNGAGSSFDNPARVGDCYLPPNRGLCNREEENWHFDNVMQKCLPFTFSGCHGNGNRFQTEAECLNLCGRLITDFRLSAVVNNPRINSPDNTRPRSPNRVQSDTRPSAHTNSNTRSGNISLGSPTRTLDGPPVDCMMSPWSDWSDCSVTCGAGVQSHWRMVKREPENSGKKCPLSLEAKRKCTLPVCVSPARTNFKQTVLSTPTRPLRGTTASYEGRPVDCMLSPWSEWSDCSATCGSGNRYQRRMIKRERENGGKACPRNLEKMKKCILPTCENGCQLSDWGSWSECSKSCGDGAVQERERRVLHNPHSAAGTQNDAPNAPRCAARLQRRMCTLDRCPGS